MLKYSLQVESDIGGRSENQDQYAYKETAAGLLVVVCDGMGGTKGGKYAAQTAVSTIINAFTEQSTDAAKSVANSIRKANALIYSEAQRLEDYRNMGTTVAAVLIQKDKACFFHAGDSRIYHLRNGEIIHRSNDHSRVGEMVKRGIITEEQARLSEESNIILRAVGIQPELDLETDDDINYVKGDKFLVCTDGIWGSMKEEELIKTFAAKSKDDHVLKSLIKNINSEAFAKGGGHDNMTVALIDMGNSKQSDSKMTIPVSRIIIFLIVLVLVGGLIYFLSTHEKPSPKKADPALTGKNSAASDTVSSNGAGQQGRAPSIPVTGKEFVAGLIENNKKVSDNIHKIIKSWEAQNKNDSNTSTREMIKAIKSEVNNIRQK